MKTMTCKELGGPCGQPLSAKSWDDMVRLMATHIIENHPFVAKGNGTNAQQGPTKWAREMERSGMRFRQPRATCLAPSSRITEIVNSHEVC